MVANSTSPALTDSQTLDTVVNCLSEHIPIPTQGRCEAQNIFEILIRAATQRDSIENTARVLTNTPSSNNIRYHLDKYDDLDKLETALNKALQNRLPDYLKPTPQKIAIDFNLIPYYGEPSTSEVPFICRSQAKNGTCSFYGYATLYVIKKGKRVTLAIKAIRRQDTKVAIITYLLALIEPLALKIKGLYLDREFFCVPVIRWLQALNIPFVMPVIIRGKQGGTKSLIQGRCSYKTTYTMVSQQYGTATFDVWVVCKYKKGKRRQHGVELFAYVVYKPSLSLASIHDNYRLRFGIESSYRMKNTCLIKTTIKKPIIRFLFVSLAFLIVNVWNYLLWQYISRKRRGSRQILSQLFTLKQMLEFLRQTIDRRYQVARQVYLPLV
ncbi:ISH3 family transposase [Aerosakkonemataceae cyanobacterium BLCC-F50]|uniref:ISH3 family transposase n=1 Tax=Floridaenema flaviceps BLCC-F50 TaxID=3153642 RepID=A0ABV4XPK3_9CYAN